MSAGAVAARHYLDHAATTDVRPEAAAAFADELAHTGNAASSHAAGRAARSRLEDAREEIAAALGADPHEVVLTSGGTEADNLAVKGAWFAARDRRASVGDPRLAPAIVLSAIEHDAIAKAAAWLAASEGATLRTLPVTGEGIVDLDALSALLGADDALPALVTVMLANNETGVIQPIPEVVEAVRAASESLGTRIPVHTDAVQALGKVDVDFGRLGVDALSLSGHKIGAPVGSGALLVRRDVALVPVEHGGGQERSVRSGTLPVAQARALAAAVRAAVAELEAHVAHLAELRARLVHGLERLAKNGELGEVRITGPGPDGTLASHVHLVLPGAHAEALLVGLDLAGVDASSASACHAGVQQPSGVLLAMGYPPDDARCALRLTLGRTSTEADVDAVLAALPAVAAAARRH